MNIIDFKLYTNTTFVSLKYPNYRLWFIGQIISLVGTWVQITAQGYLMYELTHSMAYLGYMSLASGLPTILLMLYGGVFADRFSRRYLLIITQSVMMILAFILFFLVYFQVVLPWHILMLSVLFGITNSFDVPARQAFVFELVQKKDLSNAIALNSMMFNLGAIIGPAIAGIMYASMGASWCFLVNGLSFLAIILVLFGLKMDSLSKTKDKKPLKGQLAEGMQYCFKNETIRLFILLTLCTGSIGMSFTTLLPAWATDILKGNAVTYGYLNSARGLGSLMGALIVASIGSVTKRYGVLQTATFLFPIFLLLFALHDNLKMALIFMIGMGVGLIIIFNTLNSLIQSLVSDQLRGRVMSVYSVAFFGGMPLGSFLAGIIAEFIGARTTIIISSVICFMVAIAFYVKSKKPFALS
ncbi:MAG: hypothetical protein A2381_10115 [Bdellovibrionales bacterium RIFOXYB1_FULL_37_110]|nr:MAG: hypothetical protein A2417_02630 [Bdellovibrionales bacterium RIFOXYC1_FULL_37_79]OFZ61208.1 MAG: hypothetical protein A2381_10115 [Bdellovibrionales bacterium RIFOXYB1_FULL_37_110]OFZ61616.1 MAG: hypothetical protein A2577_10465 [Bdellovibrionales bacterium RIFOXYD1_FULL_36_51]